jgi:hypothetical protein
MADNKEKNKWSDFIVASIGACLAAPEEKKSDPCIVVAYIASGEKTVSYLTMELPSKNKLYTRADFLAAIKTAEGVKNVTYTGAAGNEKDVYFCRSHEGKIIDVVDRDYEKNRYNGDISEIFSGRLKFLISNIDELSFKSGKTFNLKIIGANENLYEENTYEYAIVNAFNAFLLGRFDKSAGVDNDHIRFDILRHDFVARLSQKLKHSFGIH